MDIFNEVVCVQMDYIDGRLEANVEKAIGFIQKIRSENSHAALVVFPEMALFGYDRLELLDTLSQEEVNSALGLIAAECSKANLQVVIGGPFIFYNEEGKRIVENAVYFTSSKGEVQHIYSKAHLISSEKDFFEANQSFAVCNTALGKTGFLICWDSAFAEMGRFYGMIKVDAIIVIAAWEAPYLHQWQLSVEGRSFDNSVPVIATNRVGSTEQNSFFGHSIITDSLGNVVAENTSEKEGYISAKITGLRKTEELEQFGSPIAELMM